MCLSAGGSPWGSTTLRLLLRETHLVSFFNLAVGRTYDSCVPIFCYPSGLANTVCRALRLSA